MSANSMSWRAERVPLGSGGFGQVLLYKNDTDGTMIAVKQCKLGKELTEKMTKRWELEVRIMHNLNHRNIIQAREIPSEIEQMNTTRMELLGENMLKKFNVMYNYRLRLNTR